MSRKIRVGVVFGGRSGEHEVSLMSAASIISAIDKDRYEVVPIGITRSGKWLLSGDPLTALKSGIEEASGTPLAFLTDPDRPALVRLSQEGTALPAPVEGGQAAPAAGTPLESVDVIFPVLHGTYGEDGTVQGLLELANLPYVGAGVLASSVGMDKAMAKAVWNERGLPIVDYLVYLRRDWEQRPDAVLREIEVKFGYPVFIKPANLGSSVGISKAHDQGELRKAIDLAARYDRRILAEKAVDAREIECSVLGNDDPVASVPGEVVPCNEFYDYNAKYIDDRSELKIPAELPLGVAAEVKRLAVEAFKAIDGAGMARADFFLERGTNKLYINEVNTIPGFTKISMYPKLWEASGLSYTDLINRLIELAIERHAEKNRSETLYRAES
ncbi:MAG: D-alanine--D-alanine ligase family protein [Bacillota bacterium]